METMTSLFVTFLMLILTTFKLGDCMSVQDAMAFCRPQQVHLGYGDSTTEMVVIWSTEGQCTTTVKFSKHTWTLDESTHGESRLFAGTSNPSGIQNVHMTKLTGLEANTTYFYMPISSGVVDAVYFFKTPLAPSADASVSLMIVGDLPSVSPVIPSLITELHTGRYSAVVHTGNLARNLSAEGGVNGDRYFRELEPGLAYVPYMTTPGSWERDVEGSFSHYRFRLSTPQAQWPVPMDKMWYSVDIGPVHLISYSTEAVLRSEYNTYQHDWLIKDLRQVNLNRAKTPWVIAFGHGPMYCTYEDPSLECDSKTSALKKGLEDIFYHYGVDVLLSSYGKAYERSFPVYKGVQVSNFTSPKGPIHIVTSGAAPWKSQFNFTEPEPEWVAQRLPNDTRASFGRLHIVNGSRLDYQQIAFADGAVLDSFSVLQEKHGEFSVEELPTVVSEEIDKHIVDSGGKPGVLNIDEIGTSQETTGEKIAKILKDKDNQTRIIIGSSVGGGIIILIIVIIFVRRMRRRRRITRRWEQMDIDYGKKYYSKVSPDKDDEDNDFEIDMSDGTESNRKLISSGD